MEEKSTCNFGEHLIVDGYGGNPQKLYEKNLVLECLDELSELLDMEKLSDSQVYFAPGNSEKDPGGWSGFVVIAESHISIHTFPARGFLTADVYSCKSGMDHGLVVRYFKEKFDLEDVEENFIKRGTRYPVKNIC